MYLPLSIRRDSATGNHVVDMRMKEQVLFPRVQDAKETNLCSEMLRIACNLAERSSDGVEQQAIEFGLILQNERVQLMWQREDDVKVMGLKQFLLPRVDSLMVRLSLALVAVTIATAVV